MSSILKVNTIQDTDGNNIINENTNVVTIGKAGASVAITGNVIKSDAYQAADGGNIVSQSGTTITLGASGDTINVASGATLVGGGIDWQSTIVTGATHTASAGQGIWINTTSNGCTLTLPGSPSVGDQLIFSDFARTWNSNAVTLSLNGSKFQGATTPAPVYDTQGEAVHIVYSGSTQGWIPINDGGTALETPQTYEIQFLVIGGGGGAGNGNTGGGGAGGFRTATESTVSPGTTITVNVGNGGANTGGGGTPSNGSVSNFSGTGLTTIESAGGGGGGVGSSAGGSGGSGGGGGYQSGSGGSGNTPNVTPSQGNNGGAGQTPSPYRGGGGGGASQAGQAGSSGGNGGDGTQSSITGSAVYYAGGGGASVEHSATAGTGGQGGGGNGNNANASAGAGTANTGGGGGGAYLPQTGRAGGSGVVILSMPDANYSGTVTGSPTVSTGVSGKTIVKFTGNGTYVS